MFSRILTALMVLAVAGVAAEAQSRNRHGGNWVLLETRTIDLQKDADRIDVKTPESYRAIRFVARDREVDIRKVTVTFANGKAHVDRERMRLERGYRPYSIDFRREDHPLDHIDLEYRTHIGAAGPAKVEVWGLQSSRRVAAARPITSSTTTSAFVTSPIGQAAEPATAGSGDVLFGVKEISFDIDRDVIKIGRQYGKFGRIHLKSLGSPIAINELRVVYTSGEPLALALNANIPADGRTPWLNLDGDRFIKEIQFVYAKRQSSKAQARVEIYGDYAEGWYRPGSGAQAFAAANDGWLYLGGQSPLFVSIRKGFGYETDTVSVARNRGFKTLRLDVKDRAITLNELSIIYADGSSDELPVKQKVDGGATYGPIELKSQPVKEIKVSYRSRYFDSSASSKGYAFVEFWAK